MRTDDGDEIIEPGDYELADGKILTVYLTEDDAGQRQMWACTHCQEVDGTLNALLVSVIDGSTIVRQRDDGEFAFSLTAAGEDRVRHLIKGMSDDETSPGADSE